MRVTHAELPPIIAEALERLCVALRARFGQRLREVVLFGSRARGDASEDSDVDVLVVADDLDEADRLWIYDRAYDAGVDGDDFVSVSPLAYLTAHAADMRARERRLMREIARDGIAL